MLAIARAPLTNPTLVLLDEPSEGLAPAITDHVAEIITTLRADGVAILLVEQDLHLAFAVCGDIAILDKGALAHRAATTTDFRHDQAIATACSGSDLLHNIDESP